MKNVQLHFIKTQPLLMLKENAESSARDLEEESCRENVSGRIGGGREKTGEGLGSAEQCHRTADETSH